MIGNLNSVFVVIQSLSNGLEGLIVVIIGIQPEVILCAWCRFCFYLRIFYGPRENTDNFILHLKLAYEEFAIAITYDSLKLIR
jgi:hypothetical protein